MCLISTGTITYKYELKFPVFVSLLFREFLLDDLMSSGPPAAQLVLDPVFDTHRQEVKEANS